MLAFTSATQQGTIKDRNKMRLPCPLPYSSKGIAPFTIGRLLFGTLLLVSILLKLFSGQQGQSVTNGLAIGSYSFFLYLFCEATLAAWLLVGVFPVALWWSAISCFSLFAGVSLGKAISGEVTCDCFGSFSASPRVMLVIDSVIVGLLLLCRPTLPFAHSASSRLATQFRVRSQSVLATAVRLL